MRAKLLSRVGSLFVSVLIFFDGQGRRTSRRSVQQPPSEADSALKFLSSLPHIRSQVVSRAAIAVCQAYLCAGGLLFGATTIAQTLAPAVKPSVATADINASDRIGAIEGDFTVDKTGSARYSIPLFAVQGTAGLTPKLSLEYDSSARNGLLGVGWSIGGLSEITRCQQNRLQDGQSKPITWTAADKFCLDGQRLVDIYMGVVYKKEIDDGETIAVYWGNDGSPTHFRVQHKDGSFSFYGDAPTSRDPNSTSPLANTHPLDGKILGNSDGSKVQSWRLRKHQDRAGNPIWYQYGWNWGHLVAEVRYAYGASAGPDNYGARIIFNYSSRPDSFDMGYVGGLSGFGNSLRISSIVSEDAGTAIRTYNLSYLEQPSDAYSGPSHLSSIQECGLNNVCRTNPTQFTWKLPTTGFGPKQTIGLPSVPLADPIAKAIGDVNGDGCMDAVWGQKWFQMPSRIALAIGNCASGQLSLSLVPFTNGSLTSTETFVAPQVQLVDLNTDGLQDAVVFDASLNSFPSHNREYYIYYAEPQLDGSTKLSATPLRINLAPAPLTFDKPSHITNPILSDFNGDGIIDIIYGLISQSGSNRTYNGLGVRYGVTDTAQGGSSSRPYTFLGQQQIADGCGIPTNAITEAKMSAFGDVNADGIVDLIVNTISTQNISAIEQPVGAGVISLECRATSASWASGGGPFTAGGLDINGDGITDIRNGIPGSPGVGLNYYHMSTGSALTSQQSFPSAALSLPNWVADYNSDGYFDLVSMGANNTSQYFQFWNPSTQSYGPQVLLSQELIDYSPIVIDANGDGALDVLNPTITWEATQWTDIRFGLGGNQPVHVITQITDGLGAVTKINYENTATSTHYKKSSVSSSTAPSYPDTFSHLNGGSYVKPNAAEFYAANNRGGDNLANQQGLGKKAPVSPLTGSMWVVASVDKSSPSVSADSLTWGSVSTQALRRTNYYYGDGKVEHSIRGFLGFHTIKVVDEATGLQTITRYRQDFPFIGRPLSEDVFTKTNQKISSTYNWWAFQNWGGTLAAPYRATPEPAISLTQRFNSDVAGNPLVSTETTEIVFDNSLNRLTTTVEVKDASDVLVASSVTTNTYATDERALLGLPSTVVVQKSRPGKPTLTRTFAYEYYCFGSAPCTPANLKGFLYRKIAEPNKTSYKLTAQYLYDALGNRTEELVTGVDIVNRSTKWAYDTRAGAPALGRFLDRVTNSLNQVEENVVSRNALGQPTKANGLNNTSVEFDYGPLGRQYLTYKNDGSAVTTMRYTTTSNCPSGTAMAEISAVAGGGSSTACYDRLGRAIMSLQSGFASGSLVATATQFDLAGREHHVTEPYYTSGGPTAFSTVIYDDTGRVSKTYSADRALTSIAYNGLTSTITYPSGQTKAELRNQVSELHRVTDHLNGVVEYSYDAEGNPLSVTTSGPTRATGVPASITVSYTYDDVGRKKTMSDPDKGNWSYTYDVLGQLLTQTDAKGQVITMPAPTSATVPQGYDALGRVLKRIDKRSNGTTEETTTWTYDTATNGVGEVAQVQQATSGYIQVYSYDSLGRENGQAISLTSEGTQYNVARYYDNYGREYQTFDASGNGVRNYYNGQGHYYQSNDLSSQMVIGSELYAVLAKDAAGQITSDRLGGTINAGAAPRIGRTQTYDVMGRTLTIQTASGTGTSLQNLQYTYYSGCNGSGNCSAQYGNLQQRKDVAKNLTETFAYDGLNRLTSSQVSGQAAMTVSYDSFGNIINKSDKGNYSYANGAGPHALTSINGNTVTYDLNGNSTGTSGNRTISYNTFDKPLTITRGSNVSSFTYGPDRSFYRRVDSNNGSATKTLYLTGVEKVYKPDGTRDERRYLPGGAYQTKKYNSSNVLTGAEVEYILEDKLGSTDVIADQNGNVIQAMSFDAWGMRRNANTWVNLSTAQGFDNSQTSHGYTGHEMVDNVDIVHMRGRIYDARWGRMLQADPIIQDAGSQAQNRYAYVFNNPLSYTDPTGYCTCATLEEVLVSGTYSPLSFSVDMNFGGLGGGSIGGGIFANFAALPTGGGVGGGGGSPNAGSNANGSGGKNKSSPLKEPVLTIVIRRGAESFRNDDIPSDTDIPEPSSPEPTPRKRIVDAASDFADGVLHQAQALPPSGIVIRGTSIGAKAVLTAVLPIFRKASTARGATVIGRFNKTTGNIDGIKAGENSLLKHLPNQGGPKANWYQNAGVLRQEMNKGLPIRDAAVNPKTGDLVDYPGSFLNAERNLLRDRGWTYNPATTLWSPP